ncbi:MAG: YibE/F family protein [Eubacteriaceae bacterium]
MKNIILKVIMIVSVSIIISNIFLFPTSINAEEANSEETYDEEIYDEGTYDEGTYDEETYVEESIFYPRAEVKEIIEVEEREAGYYDSSVQLVNVLIKNGDHNGEIIQAEYELNYYLNQDYKSSFLEVGDEVLLYLEEDEQGSIEIAYVAEIARDKYLIYLAIGFVIILLLVGRTKGVKAIISLALTIFAIFKILIPSILKGWDPVIVSVGICTAVIGISLIIISGFSKKTLSAIIGTTGGVIFAGVIAMIVGSAAKLTGLGNEESQMLMYIPQNIVFDFRGLLFAGIIIGAMGATMDVGMSIASAMHEIKANSPEIITKDLIKAGMNVGRDTMATMANTLILAYTGGSLHLILLFMAYNTSFSEIVNWDMIASEILRAISGSIGIIFTIPITALVAGFIEEHKKNV